MSKIPEKILDFSSFSGGFKLLVDTGLSSIGDRYVN